MPSLTIRTLLWSLRPLFAGLCLGACSPEPPPGTRVEFVFEVDEHELCVGTPAHLDTYIERVFAFLGVAPGDFTVPVHVVASPLCGNRADESACYDGIERRVSVTLDEDLRYRPMSLLRHEVTHAVVHAAWGRSVPFFQEGLAESLSRTLTVWSEWTPEPQPIDYMLDNSLEDVDYEAAALFTRYLIDRVGIGQFRTIFQKSRGGTRDEIVAVVEAITGEEFAALEADFLSGAPRCTFALDLCGPEEALDVPAATSWSTSIAASCLTPEFYGVQSSEEMWAATQVRLNLQGSGRYRVRFVGGGEFGTIELTRCGDCDLPFVRPWSGMELELEAGLYTLELVVFPSAAYLDLGLEYLGP